MRDDYISLNFYLWPYKNETDQQKLKKYDDYLVRDLDRLQAAINQIRDHRKKMFEHIQKLTASQYTLKLSLIRRKDYYGKVFYYITLAKIFPEIGGQDIIQETYPGTERHKAIKRFEELRKQYPGAEVIKNVEKGKWER